MEPNSNSLKPPKNDPLREKSFSMAVRIVRLCRYLNDEKKEYTLSKQLLRSGTNPGAMVREAANAESPLDFVHKLGIAQKETAETQYWLELLLATEFLTEVEFQSIYSDSEEVLKLLRSSILTKKKKLAASVSVAIFLMIMATTIFSI